MPRAPSFAVDYNTKVVLPWQSSEVLLQGGRIWTPRDIISPAPTLPSRTATAIWLDAAWTDGLVVTSLATGGLVSSMVDRSGNGHNPFAPTSGRRPTLIMNGLNGLPTIRFNGIAGSTDSSALVCSTPGSNAAGSWNTTPFTRNPTIFAVASKTTTQTGYRCMINLGHAGTITNTYGFFGSCPNISSTLNDQFITIFGAGNNSNWNDTSANTDGSPGMTFSMLNNFNIWSVVNDGTTARPYVNGFAIDTKVGTIGGYWNGYRLGIAGGTVSSQNWQGDIAEIVIIATDFVTTDVRRRLEGYLAHKWGLTDKLISGHPYKNAPPMITPFNLQNTVRGT